MALVWADSFEIEGDFTTFARRYWTATGGATTYRSPGGRFGGLAVYAAEGTRSFEFYRQMVTPGQEADISIGFGLSVTKAKESLQMVQVTDAGSDVFGVRIHHHEKGYRLALANLAAGGLRVFITDPIPYGLTWNHIEIAVKVSNAGLGEAHIYVNGIKEKSATGLTFGVRQHWDTVVMRLQGYDPTTLMAMDDYTVTTGEVLGPDTVVEPVHPLQDSGPNQWTPSSGSSGAAMIADGISGTVDDDATKIEATSGASDLVENFQPVPLSRIKSNMLGVLSLVDAKVSAGDEVVKVQFNDDEISSMTVSGATYNRYAHLVQKPPGETHWLPETLDKGEFGFLLLPSQGSGIDLFGQDMLEGLNKVFEDAQDVLYEDVKFFQVNGSNKHASANRDTYFFVHIGVTKPKSGADWTVEMMPVYGGPHDLSNSSKAWPYYSRVEMPVQAGATTVKIDVDSTAAIILNGQGIPPSMFTWNPTTRAVVGTPELGTQWAFVESNRIKKERNTGFSDGGEFCLRYKHQTENEWKQHFYPAACWPMKWIGSDGYILRGHVKEGNDWGWCGQEEGPFPNLQSYRDDSSARYQIKHATDDPNPDKNFSTTGWKVLPNREDRGTSGISPYCGHILSQISGGYSILKSFGWSWILKYMASTQLAMWPSPSSNHSSNQYDYNYEDSVMRAKGRVPGALTWLLRCMVELQKVRDPLRDPETPLLANDLSARVLDILTLLKWEYDDNSWHHTRWEKDQHGNGPYEGYPNWELGHYIQNLILIQEALVSFGLPRDTKVDQMLVTFCETLIDDTYYWDNGQPHPMDSNVTHAGSTGWYLPYVSYFSPHAGKSHPTTGISPKLVICYEFAKLYGIRYTTTQEKAKLDAILAQGNYANAHYSWKL